MSANLDAGKYAFMNLRQRFASLNGRYVGIQICDLSRAIAIVTTNAGAGVVKAAILVLRCTDVFYASGSASGAALNRKPQSAASAIIQFSETFANESSG